MRAQQLMENTGESLGLYVDDEPTVKYKVSGKEYNTGAAVIYQWMGRMSKNLSPVGWTVVGYENSNPALTKKFIPNSVAQKHLRGALTNAWREKKGMPLLAFNIDGAPYKDIDGNLLKTSSDIPRDQGKPGIHKSNRMTAIDYGAGQFRPGDYDRPPKTPTPLSAPDDGAGTKVNPDNVPVVPRNQPNMFTPLSAPDDGAGTKVNPDDVPVVPSRQPGTKVNPDDVPVVPSRQPGTKVNPDDVPVVPSRQPGTGAKPNKNKVPRFGGFQVQPDLLPGGFQVQPDLYGGNNTIYLNRPQEEVENIRSQFSKLPTDEYNPFNNPQQGELDGVRYTDQRSKWQQAWQSSAKWNNVFVLLDFVWGFSGFVKLHTDLELYWRGRFVPVRSGPVDMTAFIPPCEQIKDGTYDPSNDPVIDVYRTNQNRIRMKYNSVDQIRMLSNMNEQEATVFLADLALGTVKNPMKVVELSKSYVASMASNPYTFGVRAQQVAAEAIGGLLTAGVAMAVIKAVAVICTLAGITVVGFIPAVIMGILTIGSVLAITFLLQVAFAQEFIINPLAGILSQIWMAQSTKIDNIEKACNKPTVGDALGPIIDWANQTTERMSTDIKNKTDALQNWADDNLPRTINESAMPPQANNLEAEFLKAVSPNLIKDLANGLTQVYNEFEKESESNPEFAKILKRAQEEAKRIGSPGFGVAKDVAAGRSAIAQNVLDPDTAPELKPAEIGDRL